MHITDLIGTYAITGKNQNAESSRYKGTLTLALHGENRLNAIWQIGADQTQFGIGFYKANLLVINFYYKGADAEHYHGTVAYSCQSADVLNGVWTEEMADPAFIGEETAIRLKTDLVN